MNRESIITEYCHNLKAANSEAVRKELFKDLLIRLFDFDPELRDIINRMSLGAEKTIMDIPRKVRTKTGYADTQYGQVIIEFKKNLSKSSSEAKAQLKDYVLGNWASGQEYNFTLIATDGGHWTIYALSYENYFRAENQEDIELQETDNFVLDKDNAHDFFYFLDRYLFRTEKQTATLEHVQRDFGATSGTFLTAIAILKSRFDKVKHLPEIITSFEQWHKFLSIAYGSFEADHEVFLVHSYLSIFSKILGYSVLEPDKFIDDGTLQGIISGNIFRQLNIINFIDDDFYHWAASEDNFRAIVPAFRIIIRQIDQYDFTKVREDILKGIYQELIDIETRHALGEYYTPDWLCEKIVRELDIKSDSTILDPACGSGSFLRAAIDRLKTEHPDMPAYDIAQRVVGIDIHPLSVQISKNTVLMALGNKIRGESRPVSLRVFLANTLFVPEGNIELFGNVFKLIIDKQIYRIDMKVFENPALFDEAIDVCNKFVEKSEKQRFSLDEFSKIFISLLKEHKLSEEIVESFYKIYHGLKEAKEQGRDSIWKFILKNSYKPYFLKNCFDFVIGNPPWVTYKDVVNKEYQEALRQLADKYKLLSKVANMPHLELAAIFLAHSASYFLKTNGQLAFVLPRSFLTADHHDNTRIGKAEGFKINGIWDLKGISPLFNIPSCVFFCKTREIRPTGNPKPIGGLIFSGRLKKQDGSPESVKHLLKSEKTKWHYVKLGRHSAFSDVASNHSEKANYYKPLFKQGATIVPRNFYFIDVIQDVPDLNDRIMYVETSRAILEDAKMPWKKFILKGMIYSGFLFRTALAKNIMPFGLIRPPLVVLPIIINKHQQIEVLTSMELFRKAQADTSDWFEDAEDLWDANKTERSENMSFSDRLDFQKGMTAQNLQYRYIVIYTASAKDANAVVIDRKKIDKTFIAESKTYWFSTNNLKEAYYITSFLNSNCANEKIKAFQTTGLFGPRDIHKRILEVYLPRYDAKNAEHKLLAQIGKTCEEKVENLISGIGDDYHIGQLRIQVRNLLSGDLKEIDKALEKML